MKYSVVNHSEFLHFTLFQLLRGFAFKKQKKKIIIIMTSLMLHERIMEGITLLGAVLHYSKTLSEARTTRCHKRQWSSMIFRAGCTQCRQR